MIIDREKIKPEIFKISEKLSKAGYKSYLVGGAIRDIIFGNTPNDYDILTDARCSEIARIFKSVVPYGMKHGTVLVVIGRAPYDVTSYNDGEPAPMSLENDLAARDFTINAMACDLNDLKLIDLFGGLKDYDKKEIKCVVSPEARFTKDPLRILRAVRQAAKFGFDIEKETFESARALAHLITGAAPERIMSELVKLFDAKNFDGGKYLRYLISINAWQEIFYKYYQNLIFPGAPKTYFQFSENCYEVFNCLNGKSYNLKLAYLIIFSLYHAGCEKINAYEYKKLIKALFELKFSRQDFDGISALVFLAYYHLHNNLIKTTDQIDETKIKEIIILHRELTKQKLDVREVFLLCELFSRTIADGGASAKYSRAGEIAGKIISENQPVYIEDLKINGEDIKELLGISAGNKIGEALKYAQREVIKNAGLNSKDLLKIKILQKFNPS